MKTKITFNFLLFVVVLSMLMPTSVYSQAATQSTAVDLDIYMRDSEGAKEEQTTLKKATDYQGAYSIDISNGATYKNLRSVLSVNNKEVSLGAVAGNTSIKETVKGSNGDYSTATTFFTPDFQSGEMIIPFKFRVSGDGSSSTYRVIPNMQYFDFKLDLQYEDENGVTHTFSHQNNRIKAETPKPSLELSFNGRSTPQEDLTDDKKFLKEDKPISINVQFRREPRQSDYPITDSRDAIIKVVLPEQFEFLRAEKDNEKWSYDRGTRTVTLVEGRGIHNIWVHGDEFLVTPKGVQVYPESGEKVLYKITGSVQYRNSNGELDPDYKVEATYEGHFESHPKFPYTRVFYDELRTHHRTDSEYFINVEPVMPVNENWVKFERTYSERETKGNDVKYDYSLPMDTLIENTISAQLLSITDSLFVAETDEGPYTVNRKVYDSFKLSLTGDFKPGIVEQAKKNKVYGVDKYEVVGLVAENVSLDKEVKLPEDNAWVSLTVVFDTPLELAPSKLDFRLETRVNLSTTQRLLPEYSDEIKEALLTQMDKIKKNNGNKFTNDEEVVEYTIGRVNYIIDGEKKQDLNKSSHRYRWEEVEAYISLRAPDNVFKDEGMSLEGSLYPNSKSYLKYPMSIKDPKLHFLYPQGLEFKSFEFRNKDLYTYEVVRNYESGRDLLILSLRDIEKEYGRFVRSDYSLNFSITNELRPGEYPVTVWMTVANPTDYKEPESITGYNYSYYGAAVDEGKDIPGFLSMAKSKFKYTTALTFSLYKGVRGRESEGFVESKFLLGKGEAEFDYKLSLNNDTQDEINDAVIIDILPFVGDGRDSEYRVGLRGPVEMPDGDRFVVSYSLDAPSTDFNENKEKNWQEAFSDQATMIKIELKENQIIDRLSGVDFIVFAKAVGENLEKGQKSVNNFAMKSGKNINISANIIVELAEFELKGQVFLLESRSSAYASRNNKPFLENYTVSLTRKNDPSFLMTSTTDADGKYNFVIDKKPGDFVLKIEPKDEHSLPKHSYYTSPSSRYDGYIYPDVFAQEWPVKITRKQESDVVNIGLFQKYTITYDGNGTNENVPQDPGLHESVSIKDPGDMKREEPGAKYKFLGWSTKPKSTTADTTYDPDVNIELHHDLTLYAVWVKIDESGNFYRKLRGQVFLTHYSTYVNRSDATLLKDIKFVLTKPGDDRFTVESTTDNNGEYSFDLTKSGAGMYLLKVDITGYSFVGNYGSDYNDDDDYYIYSKIDRTETEIEIKEADVEKVMSVGLKKKYTITYDGNGTNENVPQDPGYHRSVTIKGPGDMKREETGEKYIFLGWSTNPESTTPDKTYDPDVNIELRHDLTLYAVWIKTDENGNVPRILKGQAFEDIYNYGYVSRNSSTVFYPGIKLILTNKQEGSLVAETKTAAEGQYSFRNLKAGVEYHLKAELGADFVFAGTEDKYPSSNDNVYYVYSKIFNEGVDVKFEDMDEGGKISDIVIIRSLGLKRTTPGFTLTYNGNGNTDGRAPEDPGEKIDFVVKSEEDLKKEVDGTVYYFHGWSRKSDGTGPGLKAGDNLTLTENTTLYAIWKTSKPTAVVTLRNDLIDSFYPNPVETILNISAKKAIQRIEVYGVTGSMEMVQTAVNSQSYQLDMSPLNKGVYILKVYSKDGISVIKVMKK